MDLFMLPCRPLGQCQVIKLLDNGNIWISDDEINIHKLAPDSLSNSPVCIIRESEKTTDYKQLLLVLRAMGNQIKIAGLILDDPNQVRLGSQVFQNEDDGSEKVIADRMHTILPGSMPSLDVVKNESGYRPYGFAHDEFHQEDLAHLGVRFAVKPQIIGEYIRVSGVVVMTKSIDREEVFKQRNVPLYRYTCEKVIVPYSLIIPPDVESIEFELGEVDGKKTMCRISVDVQDDQGNPVIR
jgi:hypothetical protein